MIFSIVLALLAASGVFLFLTVRMQGQPHAKTGDTKAQKPKKRSTVIKKCTKKLSHDPRNVAALTELGELYYNEQNYEKAYPLFQKLFNLAHLNKSKEIELGTVSSHLGVCAYKLKLFDEAVQSLAAALKINAKDMTANFYMGEVMYEKEEYAKALLCARRVAILKPDFLLNERLLAFSLFKLKKYRESLKHLQHVVQSSIVSKEAVFYFACAMEQANFNDKALKVFFRLKKDETYGAQSCLSCGTIHEKMNKRTEAIRDYEQALSFKNVESDTRVQLHYKLAQAYIKQNDISEAIKNLKQIQLLTPNYRDVSVLITRYQELNQNSNLRKFVMSGKDEFLGICRAFVSAFLEDASVKINKVDTNPDSVDIQCTVDYARYETTELFRFFKTTGVMGDLYVRTFHSKLRDAKVDKGVCVTAGTFSDEAHKYTEGRPIDLVEKKKLTDVLKKIKI